MDDEVDVNFEQEFLRQLRQRAAARGVTSLKGLEDPIEEAQRRARQRKAAQRREAEAKEKARSGQDKKEDRPTGADSASDESGPDDEERELDAATKSVEDQAEEALIDLPWNYNRVRFDIFNSFSPLRTLDFFFVPYSTGFSYVYLMFCICLLGIFIGLDIERWKKETFVENTFPEAALANERGRIPAGTGVAVEYANGTALVMNNNTFNVTWTLRDGSTAELSVLSRETKLTQNVLISGAPFKPSYTYLSLRITCCASDTNTLDIDSILNGTIFRVLLPPYSNLDLIPTDESLDEYDLLAREARELQFGFLPSKTQRVELRYRSNFLRQNPRWLVDGDIGVAAVFESHDLTMSTRDISDNLVMELRFVLEPQRNHIIVRDIGWIEVISVIFGFVGILVLGGLFVHAYNRWHFKAFGTFEAADLPQESIKELLALPVRYKPLGFYEVKQMRKRERQTQTEVEFPAFKDTMKALVALRKTLKPAIDAERRKRAQIERGGH